MILNSVFAFFMLIPLQGEILRIRASELKDLIEEDVPVYDIRTIGEYSQGRVPGSIHIDYYRRDEFISTFQALNKEKPVVVYCAVGGRSAQASALLKSMGFKQIYDYSGGFVDWSRKGEKIEK